MARSVKGLYKRGNVWWMTYRDALGRQRFESCKKANNKEAQGMLTARRNEAMEGIAPQPILKPIGLEELETKYLAFVGHQRSASNKKLHFRHFKRILGNPPIHTLTVEVLEQYREKRRGQGVSVGTINREMATLKHALSKAVAWKLVRKAVREELAGVQKFQEPAGRIRFLSEDEEVRLLQHCRGMLKPVVVTAIHTGMRRGELLSLTWGPNGVDLQHGFIRLTRTKNGEAREIPINETVRRTLTGLRTRLDTKWVFHRRDGRQLRYIRSEFERAMEKAGLADFHFHDLRHTFASRLVMKGVPLATVSKLMGHKTPMMTMRYAHLSPEHLSAAVKVLDAPKSSSLDSHLTIGASDDRKASEAVVGSVSQHVA